MKVSNFFTGSRMFLSPIIFIIYFLPDWVSFVNPKISIVTLILIFIYAEFTDFLDGYYAREHNQVDDFGKIFDPFADVIINITVMFCFMQDGFLNPILFLIILYREFGIMFLRMKARGEGITIAAKKGGKTKTVFYITGAGISLFLKFVSIYGFLPQPYFNYMLYFNKAVYAAAVILSVLSFTDYLLSYKKQIFK
jgi:CDP-diacylglycerol--glycerol-3-phosphate 3-phosphatidyltransferase